LMSALHSRQVLDAVSDVEKGGEVSEKFHNKTIIVFGFASLPKQLF